MPPLTHRIGLFTDLYELTMAQGYFVNGMVSKPASFDYFFRKLPFGGGYVVFAGLADFLSMLERLAFDAEDISYLRTLGFEEGFLQYLKGLRFTGNVYSVREGEVVFAGEPLLRVEAPIVEAQIIETMLLNMINFQSLIATRASRCALAARGRKVVDFGLRRSQGLGGNQASRAAAIGGVAATSNVYAAREYDIPPTGTQAHSWIQTFDNDLAAFRAYARAFPEKCILLLDTYNTLESGLPAAMTVAGELERDGHKLLGVRLDSGDLNYLSRKVRERLDAEGFGYVRIVASNQLDEYVIRSLLEQGAPIDSFGVGTSLVTGRPDAALDGVYKLASFDGQPRLKVSEKREKVSLPGRKKLVRFRNSEGDWEADGILLAEENGIDRIFHPLDPGKSFPVNAAASENLCVKAVDNGEMRIEDTTARAAATFARERLEKLPAEYKRFENPHEYKVGLSRNLMDARDRLVEAHRAER